MIKGDEMYVTINMRDIFIKQIELDTNKNLIVVHVQNDIIESGNTDLEQLIDVAEKENRIN